MKNINCKNRFLQSAELCSIGFLGKVLKIRTEFFSVVNN